MDDLSPNDLSHLSDEEFNALCPQGEHAPGPEPLSPAAQALLDAYWETFNAPLEGAIHRPLAAAIRALADQVVPHEPEPRWWKPVRARFNRQCIRRRLLAIADELEGTND